MENTKFLYQKIYQTIKDDILSGKYPPGSILPSERVLSETYDAWRTTVRQALDLLVEEGLVEKKPGLGTRVIYMQEQPEKHSHTIGFFLGEDMTSSLQADQPYYSDLMYYLDIECQKNSCQFLFSTITSQQDMDLLLQHDYSLVVYLSHKHFEVLDMLKERGIPTILLNEKYKNYTVLANDQISGGFLATDHLIQMGHRHIGIISGPMSHLTVRRRLAGCYLALAEAGLQNPTGSWMQVGDWEYESGYNGAKAMFTEKNKLGTPTAIVSFNDIMAIGAMRALADLGYRVPDDVSIIGSDNIRQLVYTQPNLTTIDMKTQHTAKAIIVAATNQLDTQLAPGTNIITPVELIIRNTVKKLDPKR